MPTLVLHLAMNNACRGGDNFKSMHPNRLCYSPDTMVVHDSFLSTTIEKRIKVLVELLISGGTTMLITMDPIYEGFHFDLN